MEDIANLYDMGLPIDNRPAVYFTACELAVSLNQHLFDTLYHAVAMHNPDTTLVTADRRYFRKAQGRGRIMWIGDARLGV